MTLIYLGCAWLAGVNIEVDGQEREVRGAVLVRAPRYSEYDYGIEFRLRHGRIHGA